LDYDISGACAALKQETALTASMRMKVKHELLRQQFQLTKFHWATTAISSNSGKLGGVFQINISDQPFILYRN
jgi:hypothetical protein